MDNEEIYNFLFEQKVIEDLFDMNDIELTEQKNKAQETQKQLANYIYSTFEPEIIEKLEQLLETRDEYYKECFHLEHRLFYKNGIKDGISIIVAAISHK